MEELRALEGLELTSSNDHDFEVVSAGVDKGVALAQLAQRYGVPLDQCAAVGDSDNDLAMLQAAGVPIAMGNASQAVKDLAPPGCCGQWTGRCGCGYSELPGPETFSIPLIVASVPPELRRHFYIFLFSLKGLRTRRFFKENTLKSHPFPYHLVSCSTRR